MYLSHFGLRELPFTLTPDTQFFMGGAGHQDGLNVLLVALRSGEGVVKVTGEVGTGKTILCRTLLNALGEDFASAYVPNPYLRAMSLLLSIADELEVDYPKRVTQHALIRALTERLMTLHDASKRVVVCLDEAQAIPLQSLEALRLLTNLETEKTKLLQVVLFGQPELDDVLAQRQVRQLRQRITFSHNLQPLNRLGVASYIGHRLAVAGHDGPPLFTRRVLKSLYDASGGIPRLVNILAHKSLMAAFGAGDVVVQKAHLRAAIRDTRDARTTGRRKPFARRWNALSWLS